MTAYYNEIEPFAADWLENLIWAGAIAPGIVDRRSIEDVTPSDLKGFTQCHFFAGIGVWSYALRQAGWPDERPVWTGSCPCQPFSTAGKGNGFADERHLWPAFFHLIATERPDDILGEQVASKDGLAWLDVVQSDLEAAGYAVGALDLCAAGFGAPHIRQRLSWVAHANGEVQSGRGIQRPSESISARARTAFERPSGFCTTSGMVDADGAGSQERPGQTVGRRTIRDDGTPITPAGPVNGHWRNAQWVGCTDGKGRPLEPGTTALVDGAPNRVGTLRGYGNAIVAPKMIEFISAYMEYRQ